MGIKSAAFFGSAALGTSLHQALALAYRDWHYNSPIPDREWFYSCWQNSSSALSTAQVLEGQHILDIYYDAHIANLPVLTKPLAVEGKIQGHFQVDNLEFLLSGRYDRLDWWQGGLELIDYKSTKDTKYPQPAEIDLQIGLYYLALEERYQQSLKQLSLIFLRTGEKVSFRTNISQIQKVRSAISDLAVKLRQDSEWLPVRGDHCRRCSYARYCPAIQNDPESLPCDIKSPRLLQLNLSI